MYGIILILRIIKSHTIANLYIELYKCALTAQSTANKLITGGI